jgi:flagellar assembly protein FliH
LQEEAVKSLLYKPKTIPAGDLARYDMPTLKGDFAVGRTADHVERGAYEKGFAAGETAGFEMGQQKAQVLTDKAEALINELTKLRQTMARDAEAQCVELAVSIARKIIMKELVVKPDEIVKMAKEALLKLERTGQITIKVNPALYDFFTRYKPDLLKIHPDIVIDADPSVSQFGSVVMGPVEDVVTDVDEQIKNLIKDMVSRHGYD